MPQVAEWVIIWSSRVILLETCKPNEFLLNSRLMTKRECLKKPNIRRESVRDMIKEEYEQVVK